MTDLDARAERVRLLLETLDEPYPAASISTATLATLPGVAPGTRVPCTFCLRTGRILEDGGDRYCPACDGHGWRRRRAGEDPWDEYTGVPIRDEVSARAHRASFRLADDIRRISAQLARVEANIAASEGRDIDQGFHWEISRRKYWRQGSYAELLRALRSLAEEEPYLFSVVRLVHLANLPPDCVRVKASDEAAARRWIAGRMRGPIRVPSWLEEPAGAKKRQTVAQLVAAGLGPAQIARALGITKMKARRLVREIRPPAVAS